MDNFLNSRDRATLESLIIENVATSEENKTKILSDGWSAYTFFMKNNFFLLINIQKSYEGSHLTELGYEHEVIVHSEGFGSGERTTNTIESLWHELKLLSGFYKGIHGDPEYVQQVVTL